MNSRVSWSVDGIDPSVRERAEASARRAGMSLGDWLTSTIGDNAPSFTAPQSRERPDARSDVALPPREAQDVAEIHQRLDSITRQIEQFSKPAARNEPGVARQLNDAISRLDARLSQISESAAPPRHAPTPAPIQQTQPRTTEMVERAAAQVYSAQVYSAPASHGPAYSASPPLNPGTLDFAIDEIFARQNELDGVAPRMTPPRPPRMTAPPLAPTSAHAYSPIPTYAPPAAAPDMSGLERHLFKITNQIEALQRPSEGIEQSIAAFRAELAEIRSVITEAMPRRAIESIENEIRSLSKRIDESRQSGIDTQALAGVERALGEIREALRALTPAEQLAGFDDAIRNLGGKIDLIVRSSGDPGTMQQLEGAIAAMRAIVSNVASNEALERLSDDVHTLSSKVDQLGQADNYSDSFAALEQRIAALTSSLENRERPAPMSSSDHLEGALRALSERLDHLPVGNDSSSAIAHLEQRVSHLLERLETTTDVRPGNFSRVEDGLQDILRHLERQQSTFTALSESRSPAPAMDPGLVDSIKRELSDMRFSRSETDRHTQDSLEVVHSTLGHVVDRLAMIEGDLRAVRAAPPAAAPAPAYATPSRQAMSAPPARPELYNPVQPQAQNQAQAQVYEQTPVQPGAHFDAAPREFAATAISHEPAAAFVMPKAISEILDPQSAPRRAAAQTNRGSQDHLPKDHLPKDRPPKDRAPSRPAIDPGLPPDHPLEPGTRPQTRVASPSERIAASEEAISELPAASREPPSASSFIAAARRAAQAAAAATPGTDKTKSAAKAAKSSAKVAANSAAKAAKPANADGDVSAASTIGTKIKSLLVGASVVVIVLGSFKMAMTLLDGSAPPPVAENIGEPLPLTAPEPAPAKLPIFPPPQIAPVTPSPGLPSMTSPMPIGRQSMAAPATTLAAASMQIPAQTADVTGSVAEQQSTAPAPVLPSSTRKLGIVAIPAGEKLSDSIGGPALRNAALRGDASAAYEIGVRFAEGKGVTSNFDEAAKWYDRAAQAGVVPAMFRLGTLYEKGLSVKKDLDTARRYYVQAADRGNAKAMHNLAVLDADGGTKGANYKSASLWFRKAADRGVADSQFNLGILYARGIGVDQNLAESFKWFSLAAAQGDTDSGRKRDDIAKRLDPQSLAAAKLAIQTFVPEGQPDDAINVAAPAGGWDVAPAQATAKPASTKRAAR